MNAIEALFARCVNRQLFANTFTITTLILFCFQLVVLPKWPKRSTNAALNLSAAPVLLFYSHYYNSIDTQTYLCFCIPSVRIKNLQESHL